jgi:hypothetical protein
MAAAVRLFGRSVSAALIMLSLGGCAFPFGIGSDLAGRWGVSIEEDGFRYDSVFEFGRDRTWSLTEAKVNPATGETVSTFSMGGTFAAFWLPRSRNVLLTVEWMEEDGVRTDSSPDEVWPLFFAYQVTQGGQQLQLGFGVGDQYETGPPDSIEDADTVLVLNRL